MPFICIFITSGSSLCLYVCAQGHTGRRDIINSPAEGFSYHYADGKFVVGDV